jgi:hypothetical protein
MAVINALGWTIQEMAGPLLTRESISRHQAQ